MKNLINDEINTVFGGEKSECSCEYACKTCNPDGDGWNVLVGRWKEDNSEDCFKSCCSENDDTLGLEMSFGSVTKKCLKNKE